MKMTSRRNYVTDILPHGFCGLHDRKRNGGLAMNTKRKSGTFAILVAVIMVFAMTPIMGGAVYADSDTEQTINGVKYTLTVDDNGNKMVSVTGCDEDLTGAVEILEAVTFDEVEYPVTSIGVNAFNGKSITSITIPAGVTSIGGHAFEGTAITSITIPASVTGIGGYAFMNCQSLGTVKFAAGSNLESIGGAAFRGTAITSITIPASVTDIKEYAFNYCESLGTVTFAAGSNLESIGKAAFQGTAITSITIPAEVTSIGKYAFDCNTLDTVYYVGTQEQWNGMPDRDSDWAAGWYVDVFFVNGAADVPVGKTLIYNGAEQTGVETGEGYTLTGTTSAADAGSYEATATLADGYVWTDGTTGDKTIVWRICYEAVIPTGKNLTYDGTEQTGVEAGEGYTLTGTISATGAGSYEATATLADRYVWTDGTTEPKTILWKINKATAKVDVPAGKTFTYNGKAQTGVAAGNNYTLSGTAKATNAGTYTAKATLKSNANYTYKWSDETTAAKTIEWTINKAANPLSVKAKTATVKGCTKGKNGKLKKTKTLKADNVIGFTNKGQGAKTYIKKSGDKKITIAKKTGKVTVKKGLKKGTYKVRVNVKAAGNANYKASKVKTVTFKLIVK